MILTASARGEENAGTAGPNASVVGKAAVQPQPLSAQLGVNLGAVPQTALGPVDVAALMKEDGGCEGKCLRIGIPRQLDVPITSGQFINVPGGQLWVADVSAEGAFGMRLHFSQLNLPAGAMLEVYSPDAPWDIAGPYEGHGLFDNAQLWTGDLNGAVIRIEYFQPGNKPAAALPFAIDQIQHFYRDMMNPGQGGIATASNCEDVTCEPAWATVSKSVARISFVDGGTFLCTGQLLNDTSDDLAPNFLTANHCISTNAVANTTTFYWFYQTSTCNGVPPSLASVPKSNGATLLSTGSASDYTLLQVDGALPCGLWWSGWNTAVSNGASVACISHPGGAPKKIAFGTKQNSFGCGGGNHIGADWLNSSNGTEPGSSGGALFRSDTQQVVGQLHCGPSSCETPSNDDFGAFSSTFPNISGILQNPGSDDGFEPNDTCGTATVIGESTNNGLVVRYNHVDWYKINIPAGATFSFSLSFTDANGDIDMQLFDGCAGAVVGSSTGVGNSEFISFTNTGATGNFFLEVYLADCDTRNTYNMTISGTLANDSCGNAIEIPSTATSYSPTPYNTSAANSSGSELQESCEFGGNGVGHSVWYTFTPCGPGIVNMNTVGSNYDTVLSIFAGTCSSAVQVGCDDDFNGTLQSEVDGVAVSAGTTYLIKIAAYDGTAGGSLHFNFAYIPNAPSNDLVQLPTVIPGNAVRYHPDPYCTIGAGSIASEPQEDCGATTNSNSVWYSYRPTSNGQVYIDTNGTDYDTVLSVWTGSPLSLLHGCCVTGGVGCSDPTIQACVCASDPFCCNTSWDSICTGEVTSLGCGTCPANDHGCCVTGAAGCDNNTVQACVCASDPFCCGTSWDSICVGEVTSLGCDSCTAPAEVACDDDSGAGLNSSIPRRALTAGTRYLIKVADYNAPGGGQLNFNLTYNTCPADIAPSGGNNAVNTADLLAVINSWGPCPLPCNTACVADINGDCVVNTSDLLFVINNWGVCPSDCSSPFVCGGGGAGQCAGGDPGCFCWTGFGGGSVCAETTFCSGIVPCVGGSCPPGFVCATSTCCNAGAPVCLPVCGSGGFAPPAGDGMTANGMPIQGPPQD